MSNARDKANIPALNFSSTGIDDNATSTAITINSFGNIGIGTTNPLYDLHIADGSPILSLEDTDTNTVFSLNATSTSGIIQYQADVTSVGSNPEHWFKSQNRLLAKMHDNGDFSWYEDTGTTPKFFWDASAEKLGIGITSPSAQLHIYNATNNNDTRIQVSGSTTSASEDMLGLLIDNGTHGASSKIRLGAENSSGVQRDFDIINLPNDNVLRLDGNTEINGGSSSGTLRIRDFGGASARTVGRIQFIGEFSGNPADGNRTFAQIEAQKENSTGGATDGRLVFMTNSGVSSAGLPVEVARFDSNGKLFVGSTSSIWNMSFNVHNGSSLASEDGYNGTPPIRLYQRTNYTGGLFVEITASDGTRIGTISRASSTSVAYNTTSDYRLKENVSYDFDATSRLKQLKPARFNFIADADTTVDGFLAHEVSDIVPEAITGQKDEVRDFGNIVDENGKIIHENVNENHSKKDGHTWVKTETRPVYQGIDQSKLVPLLVKTIQELEARITALETTTP